MTPPSPASTAHCSAWSSVRFIGYALGGVLGRSTVAAVDRTEERFRSVSAETIVGGVFGGMVGVFLGVAVAWPIFFVGTPALSIPIFGFVVVVLGLSGFRVGAAKRDSMIGMFGAKAGMVPAAVGGVGLPQDHRHVGGDRRPDRRRRPGRLPARPDLPDRAGHRRAARLRRRRRRPASRQGSTGS